MVSEGFGTPIFVFFDFYGVFFMVSFSLKKKQIPNQTFGSSLVQTEGTGTGARVIFPKSLSIIGSDKGNCPQGFDQHILVYSLVYTPGN